jgi:hypothetical protein
MQKPQKLRHLLEQHGEIGRLYLAPEAPSLRAKRKRHKGNTGKNFTEGWVEFEDKRVAKQVAVALFKTSQPPTSVAQPHVMVFSISIACAM